LTRAPGSDAAVIFDLDGTLTTSELDFDAIRAEIGGIEGPILEALQALDESARLRAMAIVARHEEHAARSSRLNPDAREVLDALRAAGVPTAVLTRNSRASLRTVAALHALFFDAERTREDGETKPSPTPVLALCDALDVAPARTIVVGDYVFDLRAARGAGALAVLLRDEHNADFAPEADVVVERLTEVLPIVARLGSAPAPRPSTRRRSFRRGPRVADAGVDRGSPAPARTDRAPEECP